MGFTISAAVCGYVEGRKARNFERSFFFFLDEVSQALHLFISAEVLVQHLLP